MSASDPVRMFRRLLHDRKSSLQREANGLTGFSMTHVVHNDTASTVRLILEPSANEFDIPPGSKLTITINAAAPGLIETVLTSEDHIVFLWPGCTAQVALDGVRVCIDAEVNAVDPITWEI